MRKRIEWQWEVLDASSRRAKVIGGWVLNTHRWDTSTKTPTMSESSVFIPDRDHEWNILPPVKAEETKPQNKAADFEP